MMIDPFFTYLLKNRNTLSQELFKERKLFKEYSRFPKVRLPSPEPISSNLSDLLLNRRSRREYGEESMSLQNLSTLLHWSLGIVGRGEGHDQRTHPSGGAKFPIEMYVAILSTSTEMERGVYHYNIASHCLERLPFIGIERVHETIPTFNSFALKGQAVLYLSFVKHRSFHKYGSLAYKLAFIEGGHIGQNIYLVAEALGLSCCAMGSTDQASIDEMLEISAHDETVFYALALGTPKSGTV